MPVPRATPTLYTAARVLDTAPLTVTADAGVLVHGTEIVWHGPLHEFPTSRHAPDLVHRDLGDVTLMPGLVDAHVHLGLDGGSDPVGRMRAGTDIDQAMLMLRGARELLGAGVTTARDLGARSYLDIAVRSAVDEGTAAGPRLLTAGAPLTVHGGHCWFMGGEVGDEREARAMVRRHHERGVDLIKVMATGGFLTAGSTPWDAQFTDAQLCGVVEEAHRLGLRVAAHCHGVAGIRGAVTAGVDTLEHCTFAGEDVGNEVDPEVADAVAASPAYVSPTMNHEVATLMAGGWRHPVTELYRRGAKIIASTDAGIAHTPHHDYVTALELLAAAGLPVAEVLTAATSRAAEALGLAGVTGRIAPGMSADLVAVAGNPVADLAALREVRLVVARGAEFTPDQPPGRVPASPPCAVPAGGSGTAPAAGARR